MKGKGMRIKNILSCLLLLIYVVNYTNIYAETLTMKHGPSSAQSKQIKAHNRKLAQADKNYLYPLFNPVRPFSDYEQPGYLIMTANFFFDSKAAKMQIAKALGQDATLVLVTNSTEQADLNRLYQIYADVVPKERIRFIKLKKTSNGFWARDAFPVPLVDQDNHLQLIQSLYFKDIHPGKAFSHHFTETLISNQYYFEGGNLQTNHHGICMMVNSYNHADIPDDIFLNKFGCTNLIRLPFIVGIGHVDEHARFINESTVITDLDEYAEILSQHGFNVEMLPRPSYRYETYINAIQLGNHIVMPTFAEKTDELAVQRYRDLGFVVTTADSKQLSNNGLGSFHCITMVYPQVTYQQLLESLAAEDIKVR